MLNQNNRRFGIKDIARLCNVSPQTVSRVVNHRRDVSPETRKLVEHVIAETGYQPSALARSLVFRRKKFADGQTEYMTDFAGMSIQEVPIKIQPNSTWIMIGDSITACQRDVFDPCDLGKGYVVYVDGLLTACYPSHRIQVVNRGISGDTVREMKTRWQSDVVDMNPDWLSVCIGINDVWQQFDGRHEGQSHVLLTEFEQTLDELLTATRPRLKGLILLTPYFLQPRGGPMREMMDEYGTAIQRLAQKHQAFFVDAQSAFDHAAEFWPVESLAWDGAHLTIAGHMIMARAVLQAVDFNWSGE